MMQPEGPSPSIPPDLLIAPEWLAEMIARKPQFLARLFSVFIREEPKRVADMSQALENGDLPGLKFLAHSLKGAAATMGCLNLRQICLELEQAALAEDLDLARTILDRVHAHMEQICLFMSRHLESQAPPSN